MKVKVKGFWKSFRKPIVALCLLVLVVTMSFGMFGSTSKADDAVEMSFPARITDIVNEMNKIMSPKGDGYLKQSRNLTGNVGIFAGYSNGNKDQDGILGWITSALSSSSATTSYSQLYNFPANEDGSKTGNSLLCYGGYGWLLQELGVDSTGTSGFAIGRKIAGTILQFAYVISMVVPVLFQAAIRIMKLLNPFRLFSGVDAPWGIHFQAAPGPLGDLAGAVGRIYSICYSLGMAVVIPIMTAAMILSILIMKSTNAASRSQSSVAGKVGKWFIRLFFIIAGVPFIGAIYTSCLDLMGESVGSANTAGVEIVCSTLVDFESWARESRLDPKGMTLKVKYNKNGTFSVADGCSQGRTLALEVNRKNPHLSGVIPSSTGTDYGYLDSSNISESGGGVFSDAVWDLMKRYTSGAFYEASSFEDEQKGQISKDYASNDDLKEQVEEWFDSSKYSLEEKDDMLKANGSPTTVFNNGGLSITTSGNTRTYNGNGGSGGSYATRMGLSSMSMYNYLNTKFRDSDLVVYSTKKSSSGMVRESHRSVNVIGGGISGMFIFAQAVIQLLTVSILGIFYGFALMFSNIKRGYRIIFDTPLALMGSIQAMGKILTYAIVLIVEVVGTIFIYNVLNEVLIGGMEVITGVWDDLSMFSVFANLSGVAIIVKCTLTIIFCLVFLVMGMRMRKKFIKGIDEAVGNVIAKFVNNTSAVGSGGGVSPVDQQRNQAAIMGAAGAGTAAAGGGAFGQTAKSLANSAGHMMMMNDLRNAVAGKEGEDFDDKAGKKAYDGNGQGGQDAKAKAKADDIMKKGGILAHGTEPVNATNGAANGKPGASGKDTSFGIAGQGMEARTSGKHTFAEENVKSVDSAVYGNTSEKNVQADANVIDSTAKEVSSLSEDTNVESNRSEDAKASQSIKSVATSESEKKDLSERGVDVAVNAAKAKLQGGSAVDGAIAGAKDGKTDGSGTMKGVASAPNGKIMTRGSSEMSSKDERPMQKSDRPVLRGAKVQDANGMPKTKSAAIGGPSNGQSKAQQRLAKGLDPSAAKSMAKGAMMTAAGVYSGNAYLVKKGISDVGQGVTKQAATADQRAMSRIQSAANGQYRNASEARAAAAKTASEVARTAGSVGRMQRAAGAANQAMGTLTGDRRQAEAGRRLSQAGRQNQDTASRMRNQVSGQAPKGGYHYRPDTKKK